VTDSKLLTAIPVLPCLDIKEGIDFYQEKMGFSAFDYGNYAILKRGNIEIHLWLTNDKIFPENSSCYIRVEGIESLYDEYQKKGTIHPNGKLESKGWGIKEFIALDNSGNGIRFGELINE
jgi:hypothetical protein